MNFGFTYTYDDGTTVHSAEPMTTAELEVHKKFVDELFATHEPEYGDDYEPYYTLGTPRLAW